MTVTFAPSIPAGSTAAPPSKSMAHRFLICAALAEGESVLRNVPDCADIRATLECLRGMGASIQTDGDVCRIRGVNRMKRGRECVFPCGESGSTLRFLVPIALLEKEAAVFQGSARLMERPMSVYEEICSGRGLLFQRSGNTLRVRGPLEAGEYTIQGNISSQFVSGLLFALPLAGDTSRKSTIRILPPVESRPYIEMTRNVLEAAGVTTRWTSGTDLEVPGGQEYSPVAARVEGDWSNGAYLLALNTLGGEVRVNGLEDRSAQGDRIWNEYRDSLEKGFAQLDLADCPDLGPALFACAALRHGARFTGTRRLMFKESDRLAAMREEMACMGIAMEIGENTCTVHAGPVHSPERALSGHNDHRIVMALSLLCMKTGGSIEGAEAVDKSDPDWLKRLESLGAGFTVCG